MYVLLVSLAVSLSKLRLVEMHPFWAALKTVCDSTEFALLSRYHSHTADTLHWISNGLKWFHRFKDIFQGYHATKAANQATKNYANWIYGDMLGSPIK